MLTIFAAARYISIFSKCNGISWLSDNRNYSSRASMHKCALVTRVDYNSLQAYHHNKHWARNMKETSCLWLFRIEPECHNYLTYNFCHTWISYNGTIQYYWNYIPCCDTCVSFHYMLLFNCVRILFKRTTK